MTNSKSPIISVVVPVYNSEAFLENCIESIISQTFRDFEVILVDDGSNDNSGNICDLYTTKDSRIRTIHKKNEGVTSARKSGWLESRGRWLTFVDSDDRLFSEALSTLIYPASQDNYDLIKASVQGFPNRRKWIHRKIGVLTKEEYILSVIQGTTYGNLHATLFNKQIFRDSSFGFDSTIKIGEDVLLNIEVGSRVRLALNISDIIYEYRFNPDSVISRKVRHPVYIERFYRIVRDIISVTHISNKENFYRLIDEQKYSEIIYTFFTTQLNYDQNFFSEIRHIIKQKNLKLKYDSSRRFRLFRFVFRYPFLTIIFKKTINIFIAIQNLFYCREPREFIY